MPTNDQPLFTEGFCPKCLRYFFSIQPKIDKGQALAHACGMRMKVQWRRLVIVGEPRNCTVCSMPTYREATGTDANGSPISESDKPAATFVIVNSTVTRHMCEVPISQGADPYGQPLHPDDVTRSKVNPG